MNLYISRNKTNQLKGIAIILVILGHLNIIKNGGAWGVSIFLFISGYGLMKSFEYNGLKHFFSKKIINIIIPYSFITLLWIIIDIFNGVNYKFINIILSLIGMNTKNKIDETMWYISYIILWYLIFYIFFSIIEKKNAVKLLFIMSFIIFIISDLLFEKAVGIKLYLFQFPIGALIASKGLGRLKLKKYKNIILILSLLCLFFTYGRITNNLVYIINVYSATSILIFLIIEITKKDNKFLMLIGGISYELYLFEGIFLFKYKFIFELIENKFIALLIYLIFIISIATLYNYIIKKFLKYKIKQL